MQLNIQNTYCALYENRHSRKIEVTIAGVQYAVCMTHLRMLQRRLNGIDFDSFFYNLYEQYDMFKLTIPNHKIVQNLKVVEAIALKELVNQMFFEFDMHAVLMRNNILPAVEEMISLEA